MVQYPDLPGSPVVGDMNILSSDVIKMGSKDISGIWIGNKYITRAYYGNTALIDYSNKKSTYLWDNRDILFTAYNDGLAALPSQCSWISTGSEFSNFGMNMKAGKKIITNFPAQGIELSLYLATRIATQDTASVRFALIDLVTGQELSPSCIISAVPTGSISYVKYTTTIGEISGTYNSSNDDIVMYLPSLIKLSSNGYVFESRRGNYGEVGQLTEISSFTPYTWTNPVGIKISALQSSANSYIRVDISTMDMQLPIKLS